MKKKEKNYAFIDGQNVHLAVKNQGWRLDWKKLRIYLSEKYSIQKAYIFLGFIPKHQPLYTFLQDAGYSLIFKPIVRNRDGKVKGNCDAELVLQAMIDIVEYDKAIIVSEDGDFACLVRYLYRKNKLLYLMIPNRKRYSSLLKQAVPIFQQVFMNTLQKKIAT